MALRDQKIIGKKGLVGQFLLVAVIVIIIVIVVKVYRGLKATSNAVGQAVGNEVIAATLHLDPNRVVYIRSEAARLWNDGVKSHWYTLGVRDYDEEMFIATINEMASLVEVRLLDQLYKESSGERLKDSINASFSAADKARVNASYLATINS